MDECTNIACVEENICHHGLFCHRFLRITQVLLLTKYLASPSIWPPQNVTESNAMSHPIMLKSARRTRTEVKWMFYLAYVVDNVLQ